MRPEPIENQAQQYPDAWIDSCPLEDVQMALVQIGKRSNVGPKLMRARTRMWEK
jgi:hypothetical protein